MSVFFFAIVFPMAAQTPAQSITPSPESKPVVKEDRVYLGLAGNLNSTWIMYQQTYGEPFLDYKITFRPAFNVQIGYDWDQHWGLYGEIGFAMLGQKYDDTQYGLPTTRNIKMNYLQIPILFKYRSGGEKAQFYIRAGFQYNQLLSAKQEYLRDGEPAPPYYNERYNTTIDVSQEDIKDRYTDGNLALRLDLGADIKLGDHLFLNAGLSTMYSITQLVAPSWRLYDYEGNMNYSHNLYCGLNVGINYVF